MGTRIIEYRLFGGASLSVTPITIDTAQSFEAAPEDHHFVPDTMKSSPSLTMEHSRLRGSEEATPGSVMPKAERISPSRSGRSHRSFCPGVPNMWRTSMLPVSGAEQFVASGARSMTWPMISARGAYSTFDRPAPYSSSGRKRFHSPSDRAVAFRVTISGGASTGSSFPRVAIALSAGHMCSSMNAVRRSWYSTDRSEWAKSIVADSTRLESGVRGGLSGPLAPRRNSRVGRAAERARSARS